MRYESDYLMHYGIKGQRWGVRRFQNEDGSLTPEGQKRYTKGMGYTDDKRLNLRGKLALGPVGRFKYAMNLKKQIDAKNPYKRKDGESKEQQDQRIKQFEETEEKKWNEAVENEKALSSLTDRMKTFDEASADEKFKIINDVMNMDFKLRREGGHDNEKMADGLNDWYWDNYSKAGEARLKEYESLPVGKERDEKLTQLLKDSYDHGQDSEYVDSLVDRMIKAHGDYISRNFRTEDARKAAEEVDQAAIEDDRIRKEYYLQDQKLGKYPKDKNGSGWFVKEQIENDHPEVKRSAEKREAAWVKYCEMVLKDMGMPVNDKTLEYIQAVIIWN